MKLTASKAHILTILSSKPNVSVPPIQHWHTNTLASLIREGFLKTTVRGVKITKYGLVELERHNRLQYHNWLSTLRGVASWRRQARRTKR